MINSANQMIEVIKAIDEGQEIQKRRHTGDDQRWFATDDMLCDFVNYEYRVAPKQFVRFYKASVDRITICGHVNANLKVVFDEYGAPIEAWVLL